MADQKAADARLLDELGGVARLHGTAIKHVELQIVGAPQSIGQRLSDKNNHLLHFARLHGILRALADSPHGFVRDDDARCVGLRSAKRRNELLLYESEV